MCNSGIVLGVFSLVMTVLAVGFGVQSQRVKIRNSMDHFIDDLHRQGWWAKWATILQAGATFCLILKLLLTGQV